jgi:hypothetical protein
MYFTVSAVHASHRDDRRDVRPGRGGARGRARVAVGRLALGSRARPSAVCGSRLVGSRGDRTGTLSTLIVPSSAVLGRGATKRERPNTLTHLHGRQTSCQRPPPIGSPALLPVSAPITHVHSDPVLVRLARVGAAFPFVLQVFKSSSTCAPAALRAVLRAALRRRHQGRPACRRPSASHASRAPG